MSAQEQFCQMLAAAGIKFEVQPISTFTESQQIALSSLNTKNSHREIPESPIVDGVLISINPDETSNVSGSYSVYYWFNSDGALQHIQVEY